MSALFTIKIRNVKSDPDKNYVKIANNLLLFVSVIAITFLIYQSMSINNDKSIGDRIDEVILYSIIAFLYSQLIIQNIFQFT